MICCLVYFFTFLYFSLWKRRIIQRIIRIMVRIIEKGRSKLAYTKINPIIARMFNPENWIEISPFLVLKP